MALVTNLSLQGDLLQQSKVADIKECFLFVFQKLFKMFKTFKILLLT